VGAIGLLSLLGVIAWRVLHAAVVSADIFGRPPDLRTACSAFIAFSVSRIRG